jgi:hypothetical protein
MTAIAWVGPVDVAVAAFEDANWPRIRQAWLDSWSKGRCMACGTKRRRLEVHHGHYRTAYIAGAWRPARGAGERATDLWELCTRCHRTGLLARHDRWTEDLLDRTRRHVLRQRRRNWWRRPPTPAWTWNRQ